MSLPTPESLTTLFSGVALLGGGCVAVAFLGICVFGVRLIMSSHHKMRRNAQEAQAIAAMGHTVTATITGVREEHRRLQTGKSPVLGTPMYHTVTNYVFSAVWSDPRSDQEVTFSTRANTRGRYAIGSPVTVYLDPQNFSRYVFAP